MNKFNIVFIIILSFSLISCGTNDDSTTQTLDTPSSEIEVQNINVKDELGNTLGTLVSTNNSYYTVMTSTGHLISFGWNGLPANFGENIYFKSITAMADNCDLYAPSQTDEVAIASSSEGVSRKRLFLIQILNATEENAYQICYHEDHDTIPTLEALTLVATMSH